VQSSTEVGSRLQQAAHLHMVLKTTTCLLGSTCRAVQACRVQTAWTDGAQGTRVGGSGG
jgi:hypothetical protein